jgi:hypothetical protein
VHPIALHEIARQRIEELRIDADRSRWGGARPAAGRLPGVSLGEDRRRALGRHLGAALWEFGVDVYNAIKHVDADPPRAGRS